MLQKRIDFGAIPYGLAIAGEDLIKGSAVFVRLDSGVLKAYNPTTEAEANTVKGFVTYRIEEAGKGDKSFDTLKAGSRVVIYTLSKNDQWATTQFVGNPAAGAELVVGFGASDKGKLRAKTTGSVEATAAKVVGTEIFDTTSIQALGDLSTEGKSITFNIGEEVVVLNSTMVAATSVEFLAAINADLTDYVATLDATGHLVIANKTAGAGTIELSGVNNIALFGNTPTFIGGTDASVNGEVNRASQFKVYASYAAGSGYTDAMLEVDVL